MLDEESRCSKKEILDILTQGEACATTIKKLCRKHVISELTYYRWTKKYADLEVSEMKRLTELEAGNKELKKLVADQAGGHLWLEGRISTIVGHLPLRQV